MIEEIRDSMRRMTAKAGPEAAIAHVEERIKSYLEMLAMVKPGQ
jgi:hypothetical protein